MCGVGDDGLGRGTRPRAVQTAQPGISENFLWKSDSVASGNTKEKSRENGLRGGEWESSDVSTRRRQ